MRLSLCITWQSATRRSGRARAPAACLWLKEKLSVGVVDKDRPFVHGCGPLPPTFPWSTAWCSLSGCLARPAGQRAGECACRFAVPSSSKRCLWPLRVGVGAPGACGQTQSESATDRASYTLSVRCMLGLSTAHGAWLAGASSAPCCPRRESRDLWSASRPPMCTNSFFIRTRSVKLWRASGANETRGDASGLNQF